MSQPPPPPPHGEVPKSSGLPPGKYDIFVIPQHSAGSGFLYLPSLQPNVNSFAAGFACALIMVAMFQSMAPAFQTWWSSFQGMGNMGMTMLMVAIGVGAWALGRTQQESPAGNPGSNASGTGGGTGGYTGAPPGAGTGTGPAPNTGPPPPPPPHNGAPPNPGSTPGNERPKSSWQRPPPQPGTSRAETPKGSWEKAREETRRREEERKAKEEELRRREEAARKLRELREREAREREQREREARERRERLDAERREKELRERLEKERMEREKLQKEKDERDRVERIEKERLERLERERLERREKERQERLEREARQAREAKEAREAREAREKELAEMRKREEEEANAARKASTYAFSGVGEKINPWPNGKPKPPATATSSPSTPSKAAPSTTAHSSTTFTSSNAEKRPPAPTARTYTGTEEETFSYRPYDKPKQPRRKNSASSLSEMSWAPSHTTARTTPPPSVRGPYVTNDPDKIVIKAVYLFMNQFSKTPASQLVSGVGSVTDGLILRVTTEGLFIDDDVRGVPQREWDVKAWTLKQVEVWCPPHCLTPSPRTPGANKDSPNVLHKLGSQRIRDRGGTKLFTGEEGEVYLTELLHACKDCCRLNLCASTFKNTNIPSPSGQTGEWRNKGLHVLRATIRDQEGKRYLFVLDETESWKVAVGLRKLRGGSQVRALGVSGMSPSDARGSLEMLGW